MKPEILIYNYFYMVVIVGLYESSLPQKETQFLGGINFPPFQEGKEQNREDGGSSPFFYTFLHHT